MSLREHQRDRAAPLTSARRFLGCCGELNSSASLRFLVDPEGGTSGSRDHGRVLGRQASLDRNGRVDLGLPGSRYAPCARGPSWLRGFIFALGLQFRMGRYVAWAYWFAVVMVGIFGTMAADVLHVGFGVPYTVSTILYAVA